MAIARTTAMKIGKVHGDSTIFLIILSPLKYRYWFDDLRHSRYVVSGD